MNAQQVLGESLRMHLQCGQFRMMMVLLFLMAGSLSLSAQKFTASPKSIDASTGNPFKITYSLNASDLQNGFKPPEFKPFRIVGGPETQTSVQIINGATSASSSVSYYLSSDKTGTFTIPGAIANVKGKRMRSNSIKVKVVKGKAQPNTSRSNRQNNNRQGQQQQGSNAATSLAPSDNYFIELKINEDTVYTGQQVTATYVLYSTYSVENLSVLEMPHFSGFWSEDNSPSRPPANREQRNGVVFNTHILKRMALFPQGTGELEIEPLEIEATILKPMQNGGGGRRSIFGRFFNQQRQRVRIKSDSKKIKVRDLPTEGKPANFSGLVGQYRLTASLDSLKTSEGDPVSYKIAISGTGNLKGTAEFDLSFDPKLEVFDPKVEVESYAQGEQIRGNKSFEYILLPKEAGVYSLPKAEISYFDPKRQRYFNSSTRDMRLVVRKGDGSQPFTVDAADEIAGGFKENVIGKFRLYEKGRHFYGSMPFIALLSLPFFIFPFYLVRHRKNETERLDVVGRKRRAALNVAQKRLDEAKGLMDKNDRKAFYNDVVRSLYGYITDKVNMPLGSLSKDNVADLLREKGVQEPTINKFVETVKYCEMAVYAPVPDADNLKGTYDDTLSLIADMEDQLQV